MSAASSILGMPSLLSATSKARLSTSCILAGSALFNTFSAGIRSGRKAWIRQQKAVPSCHDEWKFWTVHRWAENMPLEPSSTFFCAQSSRPSLAVRSPSDTCCTAKRMISE
eukprot:jgi/Chrpa1/8255/Chrysochromulina_OHIO_Genome00015304-RA